MNIRERDLNKRFEKLTMEVIQIEEEVEQVVENGVYVYKLENFIFEKYNTIADAVRRALEIDAMVLLNGEEIKYDKLSANKAYYIDNGDKRIIGVRLKE